MLIITTVYIAEAKDLLEDAARDGAWIDEADQKESARQWLSVYEGKNRVLRIDGDR
jgi:hypothetical protein